MCNISLLIVNVFCIKGTSKNTFCNDAVIAVEVK